MESQGIESLIELINRIKVTDDNEADVDLMKELIDEKRYTEVITILNKLKNEKRIILRNSATIEETKKEEKEYKKVKDEENNKESEIYPKRLSNIELEERYIGLLLDNPKAISMYYIEKNNNPNIKTKFEIINNLFVSTIIYTTKK